MPTKRVTITAFLRDYFEEGSAPTRRTVLNWIRDGIIQGEQIGKPGKDGKRGGQWYVFPDSFNQAKPVDPKRASLIAEFEKEADNHAHGQAA